jgi:D-beta-D-heptose 7-phosphate kinase/D-beta-D-heptose 1-phosphate adenosyltransferase
MYDLSQYLLHLGHPRLLVVGDLMLDRYVWGDAERVSPEAPVLVLREDLDEVRPGGAANVASFLKGLEAEVVVAGVVGDDAEGRILRNLLGVISGEITSVITDDSRQTTTKQRFVGRAAQRQPHQILRVDRETRTPLSVDIEAQLIEAILEVLPTCAAVLISDYAKGVCTPNLLRAVIDRAGELGRPVLIDPSRGGDYQRYRGATLITPNRTAAELVIGRPLRDEGSIRTAVGSRWARLRHVRRGRHRGLPAARSLRRDRRGRHGALDAGTLLRGGSSGLGEFALGQRSGGTGGRTVRGRTHHPNRDRSGTGP